MGKEQRNKYFLILLKFAISVIFSVLILLQDNVPNILKEFHIFPDKNEGEGAY
jgi:hypothetical protein